MINTLIHPGVRVMQRLNLPAKFMLISAAFLVPLAVTLYAVVDYADQGIHFAERELVGTSYIPVLNEVTEKAMRLRDAGAASVSTGELSGELTATRAALTSLQKLIDSDHDTLAMAQLSTQLANDISSARGSAVASSTEALVGRLFGSYADIGDNSNLILDPDLDSFYLMSIVVDAGPKLLDALGSLRTQLKQPVANSGKDNLRMTLARVATARDSIHQAIVRGTKANPVVTQRVPSAEWESQQRELFGLSESLESDVAASRDRLQPVVEHAIESTLKLADDSNKLLVDLLNTRISGFTLRKYQVIALTLACLAGSAYLIAAFYLSNIRGFGALTDRLKKLAGGDLTANYPARGSDEIGQLINSFNLSRAELQQLVLHIHSASDAIGAAGKQIAAVNNDLAQRGAEQSAVISQTAERMQSISGKILDNMHRSENANRLAENAFEKAERGKAVVDDVVVKMDAMTESSRRIATITTVINEIAFQTNLLALNAAVEAARAGEQGRGFAVVAAEVGNLAQRSATAANEIRKLIEASVDDVEAGAKLVAVAGGTMTEILSAVSSVSEIMSEMARASKVQSHDIEAVESAVARIDSDAQQNAGIVEQTAAAAGMLHVQVTSLLKSVSHFRLVTDAEPIQTRNTQTLNAAIESGFSSRVA